MERPDASTLLKQLILEKEAVCETEGKALKDHFQLTYKSIRPYNIIKNVIKEAISGPEAKTSAVNAVIGIATGFVAKKVLIGQTHNPFSKLLGTVLEIAIANKVTNNAEEIKSAGSSLLHKIINIVIQKKN